MTDNTLPNSKAELMSLIEREWSALMDVVAQLSSTQMLSPDEGGWSPKDNLAHLSEWMNILVDYYLDHQPAHEVIGVDPSVTENWDFELMNDIMFERDRHQPVEQVLTELKSTYVKVLAKIELMTFEDLMKPRDENDPRKEPIINWVIGNTSDHFAEHRETIEKILKA
ncbi:MAG: ClbS/DfsB family four-helix bundle protein [Anaerolineales bacterium]|nr:ClbS/DfsB family four-helix bundle protein [Anaerolineales bacterium]